MNIKPIFILTAAIALAACNNDKKPASPDAKNEKGMSGMGMMMNPMETVVIAKSNPMVMLKLAGELKPDQHTEMFAKVNSYVKHIQVDIGDRVQAGQTLVLLEAPEIQSQVANAKAKLEAQEAIFLSTKATFDRMMKANETKGAIARDALDQIQARKLSDEANLHAARSAYNEIRDVNNYLVIKAPFSGTITSRNVDLGAYVGPMNKEPLLVIENNQRLRLNLSVPEANTPYIKIGDTIRFHVRSRPQEKYLAIVSRKSESLDLKLRSEKIEADFINEGHALKPYMIAETTIPLQHSVPTFFVPKSAVVESGTGIYVIRAENGKAKHVPVSKGRVMPDKTEVFGALNDGDAILKMGSEEIQEGTAIPEGGKK
ncbi:efflux RND transporter periplasmic adaptor subunit [Chitinophaga caseinilytica]|uniref:Efflux RND transporter periplasmic adaptor subunit n=1 Tax=Chitinophaga caseinilytica TaxID=2267521 RepID=A0ABZ2Z340_9BACT